MSDINRSLNNLIKELRVLVEETAEQSVPKTAVRYLIRKYDTRQFRHGAVAATTDSVHYLPGPAAFKLRNENPGLYCVYFIYHDKRRRMLLTKERGIPYDQAYAYFQYHTDYGNAIYNEAGYYKIEEYEEQTLPEEDYDNY